MPHPFIQWLKEAFTAPSFGSAIVGVLVGGAITLAGQWMTIGETRTNREDDKRSKQVAKCSSLLFKLIQILTNIGRGSQMFERCFDEAKAEGRDLNHPWAFCKESIGSTDNIRFDSDELGVLLQLKEVEVFNSIASLDNLNNTYKAMLDRYNLLRRELAKKMQHSSFDFSTGAASGEYTQRQMLALEPYMYEADQIIYQLSTFKDENKRVRVAIQNLLGVLRLRLGHEIKLEFEL